MTIHTRNGYRIRTDHVQPPIPVRDFDWSAILDDYYDGAPDTAYGLCSFIGSGPTEEAAIKDLLELVEEYEDESSDV